VKTVKFSKPEYIGSPFNALKIFNDGGCDEIVVLNIDRTPPDYDFIGKITDECFCPVAYGGGIKTMEEAVGVLRSGAEKVIINTAYSFDDFPAKLCDKVGSQSVVASIDYKRDKKFFNIGKSLNTVYVQGGSASIFLHPAVYANRVSSTLSGKCGEIFLQCIDRDGTYSGYDIETLELVVNAVDVPVVVCGGARGPEDFLAAKAAGASGAAAGSWFVFSGQGKGVLVNYPDRNDFMKEHGI